MLVADAGQAFEVLQLPFVIFVLQKLFSSARAIGVPDAVQVHKSTKVITALGGSIRTPYTDRAVFTLCSLLQYALAALLFRYFQFGPLVAIQLTGIPIGGPWSLAILTVCLAYLEHTYRRWSWVRIARRYGLPEEFDKAIAASRYVDDTLFVSFLICSCCLVPVQTTIYNDKITFDPDYDAVKVVGNRSVARYLDFNVWVSLDSVQFFHAIKMSSRLAGLTRPSW